MSLIDKITLLGNRLATEVNSIWTALNGKASASHNHTVNIIERQTIAMPTSSWSLVGDFYEKTITTTINIGANDDFEITPDISSATIKDAVTSLGVVKIERTGTNAIKICASASNTTAFNVELCVTHTGITV